MDASLDALRRAWMEERKQNATTCMAPCSDSATRVQNSVPIGFVVFTGSVPACTVTENVEAPMHKGTHSTSHAMAFDELSGVEEDNREEGNARREREEETESHKQERELSSNFHTRWVDDLGRECASFKQERSRRKRVKDDTENSLSADFALAPLITAMNKPRYLATQQRARLFAEYGSMQKTSQYLARLRHIQGTN